MYAPWYDAIQRFFGRAHHATISGGNKRVPVVFAAPDRAHEALNQIIQQRLKAQKEQAEGSARNVRPDTRHALENRPTAAPFMSIWMTRPKFDSSLYNPGRVKFALDTQSGTAKTMRWPRPMTANIQVELWAGEDGAELIAQNITAQIDLQFVADKVALPVNWSDAKWYKRPFNILEHAKVLGQTRILLIADSGDGWEDNSDLEFGDRAKEIRCTWSGRIKGYIPYPPEEARLVTQIQYEIFDGTDPDNPVLLDVLLTGAED